MKNYRKFVSFLVFIVLFSSFMLSGCSKKIAETQPNENPLIENPTTPPTEEKPVAGQLPTGLFPKMERQFAPDFDLPKLDGSGNLSLASLKGKIVLLDFTQTTCIWCERQEPQVIDLFKKYESKGFTIVAIDCREPKETILGKYPGGKSLYPVLLDETGYVSGSQFGVQGYPHYLLLDKDGKVAYIQSGYKEDMFDNVSKIIDYLMENES
jgi:peroxiredoxin